MGLGPKREPAYTMEDSPLKWDEDLKWKRSPRKREEVTYQGFKHQTVK